MRQGDIKFVNRQKLMVTHTHTYTKLTWNSKHQQVLTRKQIKICFVLAHLFPQAPLGNLLSPAELWLCLLSISPLTPRCVVSLFSPRLVFMLEGLPQSPPLLGLILSVASLLAWLLVCFFTAQTIWHLKLHDNWDRRLIHYKYNLFLILLKCKLPLSCKSN